MGAAQSTVNNDDWYYVFHKGRWQLMKPIGLSEHGCDNIFSFIDENNNRVCADTNSFHPAMLGESSSSQFIDQPANTQEFYLGPRHSILDSRSVPTMDASPDKTNRTVGIVFDVDTQKQYMPILMGPVKAALPSNVTLEVADTSKRYKMIFYVMFTPTGRLQQNYNSAKLDEWRRKSPSLLVVIIRYGRNVEKIRNVDSEIKDVVDIVELAHLNNVLTKPTEPSSSFVDNNESLRRIAAHVNYTVN